jgi:3'-phosphoadenosine 5'-phosphosulfate sulfotransferase (PAPS reductase)/FAD synthetase
VSKSVAVKEKRNEEASLSADKPQPSRAQWANRIVKSGEADPRVLLAHPENWRQHPPGQREALTQVLDEVGWVQDVIVSQNTGRLLDGHLRVELALERHEKTIPVTWVDVTEQEELLILTSIDPIAALAKTNKDKLRGLLDKVQKGREDLFERLNIAKGFRDGAGHVKGTVTDWADKDSFYAIPPAVLEYWDTIDIILVQFSGGKDSTAAALWAAKNRGARKLELCFVDPGVEFPGITSHIRDVALFLGVDFKILKPELDWWTWVAENGWPSLLYRPCAMDFIHKPFAAYVLKHEAVRTLVLTGSRAEEAVRGSTKTATSSLGSLGKHADKYHHFAPCFSVKKDIENEIIEASGVPIWEGYSRGFIRTACWCCPGMHGDQALALQKNYPGLADDIRRWEKKIGPFRPLEQRTFDQVLGAGQKRATREEVKSKGREVAPADKKGTG